jgi:hypothetical protein
VIFKSIAFLSLSQVFLFLFPLELGALMVRGRDGGGDGLAGLMKGLKLTEEKCGVRVA